jgi:hypothetical protein
VFGGGHHSLRTEVGASDNLMADQEMERYVQSLSTGIRVPSSLLHESSFNFTDVILGGAAFRRHAFLTLKDLWPAQDTPVFHSLAQRVETKCDLADEEEADLWIFLFAALLHSDSVYAFYKGKAAEVHRPHMIDSFLIYLRKQMSVYTLRQTDGDALIYPTSWSFANAMIKAYALCV